MLTLLRLGYLPQEVSSTPCPIRPASTWPPISAHTSGLPPPNLPPSTLWQPALQSTSFLVLPRKVAIVVITITRSPPFLCVTPPTGGSCEGSGPPPNHD